MSLDHEVAMAPGVGDAPDEAGREVDDQSSTLAPAPAGHLISVQIGRVGTGASGTNVHLVVMNLTLRPAKDIDIQCKARDARGMQLAEVSTHIDSIGSSDVAFENIVFPTGIDPVSSQFGCTVKEVATAGPVTGP